MTATEIEGGTLAERAVSTIEVIHGGPLTTVQDLPGRVGLWHVGVPPSGPMDDLAHRLANRVVGNAEEAPALELTTAGPTLRFTAPAVIARSAAVIVNGVANGATVRSMRPCVSQSRRRRSVATTCSRVTASSSRAEPSGSTIRRCSPIPVRYGVAA